VRLPRDVSGERLVTALRSHGYELSRQTGSHLRLTSSVRGSDHHITIPRHDALKVGTLAAILADVTAYLGLSRDELLRTLSIR
jgi:predicted RNA binding protein YcfA (HicA-like mRNA interferase family)